MFVKIFLSGNPFWDAFLHSDFLGKLIFIGLVILSIASWAILIFKVWITRQARQSAGRFKEVFDDKRASPLSVESEKGSRPSPFIAIYQVMKRHTLEILNKNRQFGKHSYNSVESVSYLSPADIAYLESHVFTAVASQTKELEKNLYVLATIVSLAPFLGLLGTVWGILTTFSELQAQTAGSTHSLVLGGLSLALATTVLGLVDAIPALIGYNYLKNAIRDFETEMEAFATDILSSVEMHYRKVDIG